MTQIPKRQYQLEHAEQVRLMTWADLKSRSEMPELKLLHAIPNGGQRNLLVAKKMKQEGAKAGVPDLHLPVARGGHHSLYIEMKNPSVKPKRGGKGGVSDLQRWWHDELRAENNRVEVCYGYDEAIKTITDYLKS